MEFRYKLPQSDTINLYDTMLLQKHMIIAGKTGSGKSVLVNGLLHSILHKSPKNVAGGAGFILIDPKRYQLKRFKDAPHCICHARYPEEIIKAFSLTLKVMEARFEEMDAINVELYQGGDVYIIIDEWADVMCTLKKQIVPMVQRIAQMGRAAKIHLVLCTQCLLAKILPTEVKCNFDSIFALKTANVRDSRYLIGIPDCYTLPDYGSCYISCPKFSEPVLYQGIKPIPNEEIEACIKHWRNPQSYLEDINQSSIVSVQ